MELNQVICSNLNNSYKPNKKDNVCTKKSEDKSFANIINNTAEKKVNSNIDDKQSKDIKNMSSNINEINKLEVVDKEKHDDVLENLGVLQMIIQNYYNNNIDSNENIILNNFEEKNVKLNENIVSSINENAVSSINENASAIIKMIESLQNSDISKTINMKQFSENLVANLKQLEKQISDIELSNSNNINQQENHLSSIANRLLPQIKKMVVSNETDNLNSNITANDDINGINITKLDNSINTTELENAIKNSSLGKNIVTTESNKENISDMIKVEGVLNDDDLSIDSKSIKKEADSNGVDKSINISLGNKTLNRVNSEIKISDKSDEISNSVLNQVKDKIVFMSKQNINAVKMQLHPTDLGELDIKLLFEEGKLSVEILAANTKTQSLIASNLDELKDILKNSMSENSLINIDVKEETSEDYLQHNNQGNSRQQYENQEQESYNNSENELEQGIDYISFQDEIDQLINNSYN